MFVHQAVDSTVSLTLEWKKENKLKFLLLFVDIAVG